MSFAPAVVLSAVTLAVYLYCQVDWQGAGNFRQAAQNAPQILYVLESEGAQEWQAISAEASAVSWVADLKDRLTISPERPLGEDVTIPSWWVHKEVQPLLSPLNGTEHMDANGGISLFNVVEAQRMSGADSVWLPKYLLVLFQMTMISNGPAVEDLHVTASKSFWQTVEATAANREFIFKADNDTDAQPVPGIAGYAILLPTILSVMYGQGEWPEQSVSGRYGDHTAWDQEEIVEMLDIFVNITEAITLPDLKEYYWRNDKVAQYEVFQRYYEQDPIKHAAPIPTVPFSLRISKTISQDICYAQRYLTQPKVSDYDIRATAASIIAAAIKLDSNADASAIQRHNPKVGNSTVREYIIKRNHSGFARKVIQLTLDLSNWQPGSSSQGLLKTAPGPSQQNATLYNRTDHKLSQQARDPSHGMRSPDLQDDPATASSHDPIVDDPATNSAQSFMLAPPLDPSWPARHPSLASRDPSLPPPQEAPADQGPLSTPAHASSTPTQGGNTVEGSKAAPEVLDRLHDAQQLMVAAERMLREGCGELWLLQPLIPDMGCNEYRVNLIGGTGATGTATDTAAVFTPAKAADKQLYMYNFTLPHAFFSRSPPGATDLFRTMQGNSMCSSQEEGYHEDYFPFLICKEPAMHQLLVDVALAGAQAFIHSQRPSRMSHNVLLRIDIALTWNGDQVRPFINEAHYFADATLMFPVWPPEPKSVLNNNIHQAAQQQQQQQPQAQPQHTAFLPPSEVTGWGLWLAEQVWNETQWRVAHSRHRMQGQEVDASGV